MNSPRKHRPDSIKDPAGRLATETHEEMLSRHAEQKQNRRIRHSERHGTRSAPPVCLV